MRLRDEIKKTRSIGGFTMEMQVANIISQGVFQATYYKGAEPFIWGQPSQTESGAIEQLDALVDLKAVEYPTVYGAKTTEEEQIKARTTSDNMLVQLGFADAIMQACNALPNDAHALKLKLLALTPKPL